MAVVNLTIDVPDGVADQFHTLPEDDRRDFLAKVNAFAVATLRGEAEADYSAHLNEREIANLYQTHPLPPLLSGTLVDDLRAGYADIDAGRVVTGEAVLARLRQRAGIS